MPEPLSEVQLAEEEILLEGFEAILSGEIVTVTAVLERTCVYVTADGERRLANKHDLLVEPNKLPIRRRRLG
jgi:hypothetical protein